MKFDRTKNAFRNTVWGAVYRLVALIGPFVIKTIIIKRLGMEYSGLNTLFNSILTVLNLANLGFSGALVYTMYKAVAEEDNDAICAMLNFFRTVYRIIGVVILAMGIAVMPFLPQLVGEGVPPGANLYIMFALYLAATVMDYVLFGYVNAIFSAYQREDMRLKIMTIRYIVQYILQIVILAVFANFYLYLITLPLMVIPNSIANYRVAKKCYPQVTCKGIPCKEIRDSVYHRVKTLFAHKVGNTMLVNVDSIIISSFLGLSIQSIYSNYYYILTAVNGLVEIITNGCLAGIGNKLIVDSEEDNHVMFQNLTYGWIALIGFCTACMLCLYQPFIGGVWIGQYGLLDEKNMVLLVVLFYSWMFRLMQLTYRDAAGLWTKDWLKPILAMVFKLSLSIVLVSYSKSIAGALIPTILIMLLLYVPWEARVLYRNVFHCSMKCYLLKLIQYTLITAMGAGLSYACCQWISPKNSLISFAIRLCIVCVIFPSVWVAITHRTKEFHNMLCMVKRLIAKK